jgi:DNA repair ATPase RecN
MKSLTENIEDYLKENKYKFITDLGDSVDNIEILFGSESGFIQIEKSIVNDGTDNSLVQIYDKVDDFGESTFVSIIDDAENNIEEVFVSIVELKDYLKVFTKKTAQIQSYIEKINDICDELQIDPETFITINYNF